MAARGLPSRCHHVGTRLAWSPGFEATRPSQAAAPGHPPSLPACWAADGGSLCLLHLVPRAKGGTLSSPLDFLLPSSGEKTNDHVTSHIQSPADLMGGKIFEDGFFFSFFFLSMSLTCGNRNECLRKDANGLTWKSTEHPENHKCDVIVSLLCFRKESTSS